MSDEQQTVSLARFQAEQAKSASLTKELQETSKKLSEAQKNLLGSYDAVVLINMSRETKLLCLEEQIKNRPSVSFSVDGVAKSVAVADGNRVALRMIAHASGPEMAEKVEKLQTSLKEATEAVKEGKRELMEETKKREASEKEVMVSRKRIKLVSDANTRLGNALKSARKHGNFARLTDDVSDNLEKLSEAVDEEHVPKI